MKPTLIVRKIAREYLNDRIYTNKYTNSRTVKVYMTVYGSTTLHQHDTAYINDVRSALMNAGYSEGKDGFEIKTHFRPYQGMYSPGSSIIVRISEKIQPL